jgi:biopolymer transport protein ExbD
VQGERKTASARHEVRPRFREEPEINFIPLIDVLLVILIFLMVTTTYSRYAELKINLPTAEADQAAGTARQVDVAVDAKALHRSTHARAFRGPQRRVSAPLKRAAGRRKDPVIVINADANATHQSVCG